MPRRVLSKSQEFWQSSKMVYEELEHLQICWKFGGMTLTARLMLTNKKRIFKGTLNVELFQGQALAKINIGDVLDSSGDWAGALQAFEEGYR